MFLHLLKDAFHGGIITVSGSIKRSISPNRSETEPHGGIGIRIEIPIGIHTAHGSVEQTFTLLYLLGNLGNTLIHLIILHDQIQTQRNSRVFYQIIRSIPFQETFQTLRRCYAGSGIQRIHISLNIPVIKCIYLFIYSRQILLIHFQLILFEHGSKNLLINGKIEIIIFRQ